MSEYPNEYQITHKNIKRPFQHRLISFLTHQTQKKRSAINFNEGEYLEKLLLILYYWYITA